MPIFKAYWCAAEHQLVITNHYSNLQNNVLTDRRCAYIMYSTNTKIYDRLVILKLFKKTGKAKSIKKIAK